MKIIINYYILLLFTLTVGCISQQRVIDINKNDVTIFDSKKSNFRIAFLPNIQVENTLIVKNGYSVDVPIISSYFFLVKGLDTMGLFCECGEGRNYFFKDIEFKKGFYAINLKKSLIENYGSEIITSKALQNVLFKNAFTHIPNNGYDKKDMLFKDLKFIITNFSDTINVKLIPMSKDEFFTPR